MSIYENIASVVVGILVVVLIVFSYNEIKEPPEGQGEPRPNSGFDQSVGQDFKIGPYASVVSEQTSGGPEENCSALQPVIIGVLHDIKERLEHQKAYNGTEDAFEVNEPTLRLLCNKTVTITLADSSGNKLVLQKAPFALAIPPQGGAADIGTRVHIDATLVAAGGPTPTQPTTFGDELIPDRFLDMATSTSS